MSSVRRDAKRCERTLPPLRIMLALIVLLAHFSTSSTAQATTSGRAECRSAPSKILGHSVPYCVILPPSYDSGNQRYPILYFLHGLGSNAQLLIDQGGMDLVNDLWTQNKIREFLIVTPDADRSFYINSRDGKVRYEDFFIHEFIPYIESHYRVRGDRQSRGISGVSMGGYGSLHLALRHAQLFGSVSAHSAALVANLPAGGMTGDQGGMLSRVLGTAFGSPPDAAYWKQNNPFTIVSRDLVTRVEVPPVGHGTGLQIYFDCGTEDEYGFNVGAQAFHDLLDAHHIPNEFHLYPGGHDWSYVAEHFAASLEFHSRAFGVVAK
ncbi:MAG TPA: alpha/beta hydrolase family protein [Candidatus Acidoferrales bacterium]|nr:alpha/beta hydrolase family protein [Candidatus Acidoferrales bacterium]